VGTVTTVPCSAGNNVTLGGNSTNVLLNFNLTGCGGNVSGPASQTTVVGDLAMFGNANGTSIADSGLVATNVVQNFNASAVSGNLPMFNGTSGTIIDDSGVSAANLVQNLGPTPVVSGNLCSFNGTGGKNIQDAGTALSRVVTVPASLGVGANPNVPYFNNTAGHTALADSGIPYTSVVTADNGGVTGGQMAYWENPYPSNVLTNTVFTLVNVVTLYQNATAGHVPIFNGTFSQANIGLGWSVIDSNVSYANLVQNFNASAVSGNLPMFNGTSGRIIDDSGLNATQVPTIPTIPGLITAGDIPIFSNTGSIKLRDSFIPINQMVTSSVPITGGNLPAWVMTEVTPNPGNLVLADTGIASADVVQNFNGSAVSGNLPMFNGTSGTIIDDSGLAAANSVYCLNPTPATNDIVVFGGGGVGNGHKVSDSGVNINNVVQSANGGASPGGYVPMYVSAPTAFIINTSVLAANLVQNFNASAVSGNLPMFNGTSGRIIDDSGVAAVNVVTMTNTTVEPTLGGTLAEFFPCCPSTSRTVRDTGILASAVVTSNVVGLTQTGELMLWNGATGTLADGSLFVASGGTITFGQGLQPVALVNSRASINQAGMSSTLQSGGAFVGGTNLNAGDAVLSTGISTGTGRGNIRLQASAGSTASGTADNSVTDRVFYAGMKTYTSGSATTAITLSMASGDGGTLLINYGAKATNGTDVQISSGTIMYVVYNIGGTYHQGSSTIAGPVAVQSTGSLTVSWAAITAAGLVRVTITSSGLTGTVAIGMMFDVDNMSNSAITVS
jgi:hypothetical protein